MNKNPSVVFNVMPLLSQLTGVGQYTCELAKQFLELSDINITYYPPVVSCKNLAEQGGKGTSSTLIGFTKKYVSKSVFLRRAAKQIFALKARTSGKTFDIYFEPNFINNLPYKYKKNVITVHDFSFKKYPMWHPKSRVQFFEKVFWKNIQRADAIITVSDFIKKEAVDTYGLDEEKIFSIPNGVNHGIFSRWSPDAIFNFKQEHNLPENFILFAGSLEPRKNITTLVKAYTSLSKSAQKDFPLLLAGGGGWLNGDIKAEIEKNKRNIKHFGYVDQQFLVGLYNCATCFVYIPWYEGFGLPPLEAMACGCPCIVSKTASLPEVCGEAALFVNPASVDETKAALLKIMDEQLQERLRLLGKKQSANFSWEKSASLHKEIFLTI